MLNVSKNLSILSIVILGSIQPSHAGVIESIKGLFENNAESKAEGLEQSEEISKKHSFSVVDLHCPGEFKTITLDKDSASDPFALKEFNKPGCSVTHYSNDGRVFFRMSAIKKKGDNNQVLDLVHWECSDGNSGNCDPNGNGDPLGNGCGTMKKICEAMGGNFCTD